MRSSRRLLACVTAALFLTACSRDPKPGTTAAATAGDRIMRSMSDTLAHAKAFTFATSERLEIVTPAGEKRALRFTRKVAARRPDALFFEIKGMGDTTLDVAAYYDGQTLTMNDNGDKVWSQTTVPSNLDDMLDDVARRFALPVPIGDVVYSSPHDAFIGRSTRGGFVGRESIDGVSCAKLDYDDPFVEVRLWIPSSGQPLPRRIELVYKTVASHPVSQIDFTSWNLDARVPNAVFSLDPEENYRRIDVRDFVAGMIAGVMPPIQVVPAAAARAEHTSSKPRK